MKLQTLSALEVCVSDRLQDIETNLELLREQQTALEREVLLTTGLPKTQAEQRLRLEIKPKIQEYEAEKWRLLAKQANELDFPEPDATVAVTEIVEAVTQLETQPVAYPDEMMQILREIRDKLNEPSPTAAGKLKGILSSYPPFFGITYEAELDTENFARKYFPTFKKLLTAAAKK